METVGMEDVRYKVSAQHTNARAYRHFYGHESRTPGMERGSRVATMLKTAVHRARGGAAVLAERVVRGLARMPTRGD
jgi:hypothetical protein